MYFFRTTLVLASLIACAAVDLPAQKKKPATDDGYIPTVLPESKQKKQKPEETQVLPLPRELPNVVIADTDRLAFGVSPLSAKGLLSQQTRDAMKKLMHDSHGTIVKLRAFVAGSGDLRRVRELAAEIFSDKHQPLPALSVVQVGALPLTGAQVVIESIEMDKRPVNPNGVAFLSGQPGPSVAQSLAALKTALSGAGLESSDMLRVTCFVSSFDLQRNTRDLMSTSFPKAALNYVQMRREPSTPAAECEAVARLRSPIPEGVRLLNPPGLTKTGNYSQIALVTGGKLAISGTQMAFGSEERDLKLAFDRLEKTLSSSDASFDNVVMSHVYLTSRALINSVRNVRAGYYAGSKPPASTMLPFEGLPALDTQMGVDVIAVSSMGSSSSAQR
jgi:enamine deaminase RidA (YjgF/YER057c/UK114 family)